MKFSKLEEIMSNNGIMSLAEIARSLKTTPQAVSNWKSRDQVPSHIAIKFSQIERNDKLIIEKKEKKANQNQTLIQINSISLSDILLTISQQIKIVIFVSIISLIITFTFVKFIQIPKYISSTTILLPENQTNNIEGLAGLASQFGVNVPMENYIDLSNPSLYPDLLKSRTFARKILDKIFYYQEYKREMPLLNIITKTPQLANISPSDDLISSGIGILKRDYIEFKNDPNSSFSTISITSEDPFLSKQLADLILIELDELSRSYKSKTVNDKIKFINQRIKSVKSDLQSSEEVLKIFNEQNRQISSPALQLQLDRLTSDVEIQKAIFLTLKQQYELAKIEEVQEASIVQILDYPEIPLSPRNKRLILKLILSLFIAIGIGSLGAFSRAYINNDDIGERKKLRRVKNYLIKKTKDFLNDRRISLSMSFLLLALSPFYLFYKSDNPIYLNRYSLSELVIILVYCLLTISFVMISIKLRKRKNHSFDEA